MPLCYFNMLLFLYSFRSQPQLENSATAVPCLSAAINVTFSITWKYGDYWIHIDNQQCFLLVFVLTKCVRWRERKDGDITYKNVACKNLWLQYGSLWDNFNEKWLRDHILPNAGKCGGGGGVGGVTNKMLGKRKKSWTKVHCCCNLNGDTGIRIFLLIMTKLLGRVSGFSPLPCPGTPAASLQRQLPCRDELLTGPKTAFLMLCQARHGAAGMLAASWPTPCITGLKPPPHPLPPSSLSTVSF